MLPGAVVKNSPAMRDRELAGWGFLLVLAMLAFFAVSGVYRGSAWLIPSFFLPTGIFLVLVWRMMRFSAVPVSRVPERLSWVFRACCTSAWRLHPAPSLMIFIVIIGMEKCWPMGSTPTNMHQPRRRLPVSGMNIGLKFSTKMSRRAIRH